MQKMHRTQVYLQPELSDDLDRIARQRGISRAELIRVAARRLVDEEMDGGEDAILGLIGIGKGGPGEVSTEHDRFLAEHALKDRRL